MTVTECDYFGGADEGEVEWIEEEDDPTAAVLGECDRLKLAIDDCGGTEVGSGTLNERNRTAVYEGSDRYGSGRRGGRMERRRMGERGLG